VAGKADLTITGTMKKAIIEPQLVVDPAVPLRKTEYEIFAQAKFEGLNSQDAYLRAYNCSKKAARINAGRLITNDNIQTRIRWLQEQAASKAVMSVQRRKEVLSRIGEEVGSQDPADYLVAGADGTYVSFGPESKNRKAVAGVESRTIMVGEGDGAGSAVITKLKLRSFSETISAIDTLNKMDGLYQDQQDDKTINVIAIIEKLKPRILEAKT